MGQDENWKPRKARQDGNIGLLRLATHSFHGFLAFLTVAFEQGVGDIAVAFSATPDHIFCPIIQVI
jgi:hypothetical protein